MWGSGVVGIRGVSEVNPETGSSIGVLRIVAKEEHRALAEGKRVVNRSFLRPESAGKVTKVSFRFRVGGGRRGRMGQFTFILWVGCCLVDVCMLRFNFR